MDESYVYNILFINIFGIYLLYYYKLKLKTHDDKNNFFLYKYFQYSR